MTFSAAPRSRLLAVPLLALSVLLTGCMDDDADPAASEPPVAVIGPEECLLGTWKVDNPTFEKFMNSFVGPGSGIPAGIDASITVTGGSYLRFDDEGSYYSWRDDFAFTVGSGAQTVTHVSNSGETGEYGVVLDFGGLSNTHHVDMLWVAETMTVVHDEVLTVGGIGQVVDQGGPSVGVSLFDGYRGEVPVIEGRDPVEGSTPFTCEGDVLTIEYDFDDRMLFHRSAMSNG